jgi:predicted nucleotidyltransferase
MFSFYNILLLKLLVINFLAFYSCTAQLIDTTESGSLPSDGYLYWDSPSDPENFLLRQYQVTNPEPVSQYSGTVELNAAGEATIVLPPYFQKLHPTQISYHLTPQDTFLHLYVKQPLKYGAFIIGTTEGAIAKGRKVSWLVNAIRNDKVHQNSVRQSHTLKKIPGKIIYNNTYKYLDVLQTDNQWRQNMWELAQRMSIVVNMRDKLIDACIVGSFAQGYARDTNSAKPSDIDLALIFDRNFTIEERYEFRKKVMEVYHDTLKFITGTGLGIDISFQTGPEMFETGPNTVYFSLKDNKMVGRDDGKPVYVKLIKYNNKYYRFPRGEWTKLMKDGTLLICELVLINEKLAYRNKSDNNIVLISE